MRTQPETVAFFVEKFRTAVKEEGDKEGASKAKAWAEAGWNEDRIANGFPADAGINSIYSTKVLLSYVERQNARKGATRS